MTEEETKLYELALKSGNKRYGSVCRHTCLDCKRVVIAQKTEASTPSPLSE